MSHSISHNDQFEHQCNLLREFTVLRERLPKRSSQNKEERSLANFVSRQRSAQDRGILLDERARDLNNINRGILAFKAHLDNNNQPSDLWEKTFESMAGRNTAVELRKYQFATTDKPFIPTESTVRSYEEFMIRKMKCIQYFTPDKCHPDAPPATMQRIFSYALHPNTRPNHRHLRSSSSKYYKNSFNFNCHPFYHSNSGTIFPGCHQSEEYLSKLYKATEAVMPNNLVERMRTCATYKEFKNLEQQNEHLFDTFNYGIKGQGSYPLTPIMSTNFNQPRRMGFSAFWDRVLTLNMSAL